MKVFGYGKFNENGEMPLVSYEGEYAHMNMDIRVYAMKKYQIRSFEKPEEEMAVLLLSGDITYQWEGKSENAHRKDVFTDGPYALHVSKDTPVSVMALSDCEILVQCTKNERVFASCLYTPADAPWKYSCKGLYGNTANRRVNTIFDHDICPESNMVLGEVLNDRGNWSGYLPHRHPQPECYFFKFDRPEGFGASFVGDEVFKSVNNSFSAIPGGRLHPQSAAPGYQMYTCWMIRHIDGNPWLQTDRCEDEAFTWMHDAKF
ncbi:MAG: 5-deoxy-glucuronate isomerase [Lachnospiraceae bacterium]|uniref:5-deoxy-glucuronate isomerase n=1 Tax=Galactobacillus timonensis TaxID=2041840 RepID=UPI0023F12DC8|nr:5-deoxy-glucuronate isomerase [Galactobacillus timonensis]MCI6754879.1 5-deoxy-glucuronate isomerase [Galactobacillus timonensis]MDD7087442.1 5-deoxy-glucuronate isomerase [Galactobacillus timonensis]MDY5223439.1 5-deoxy-glucuronate isomerase [Lachnospiraceae bacterium]